MKKVLLTNSVLNVVIAVNYFPILQITNFSKYFKNLHFCLDVLHKSTTMRTYRITILKFSFILFLPEIVCARRPTGIISGVHSNIGIVTENTDFIKLPAEANNIGQVGAFLEQESYKYIEFLVMSAFPIAYDKANKIASLQCFEWKVQSRDQLNLTDLDVSVWFLVSINNS